ncbi:MAG: hypothetical protein Q8K66_13265 [Sediminibacterium sp.]|nr:hypothetical protein [Sediminibacterium sp.]MDP3129157.1 hypothetical protein [Sediminibacterium sp.]
MRKLLLSLLLPALVLVAFSTNLQAQQQLLVKDFVLYSVKDVKLNEKIKITGDGNLGSKKNITLKKESTIAANIYGFEKIDLDKASTFIGNITAYNNANSNDAILKGEKSIKITGNLLIKGKIKLTENGSSVIGSVRQPNGASYAGPTPTGGITNGVFTFPIMCIYRLKSVPNSG